VVLRALIPPALHVFLVGGPDHLLATVWAFHDVGITEGEAELTFRAWVARRETTAFLGVFFDMDGVRTLSGPMFVVFGEARLQHLVACAMAVGAPWCRGPAAAWLLVELIRYLEHPRSSAAGFDDMGAAWVPIRECG
jgi:hypothetical protein